MSRALLRLALLAAVWVAALSGAPAWALAPALHLAQLHHQAWLTRDGAPTDINAIRQTPDGFLWLGTANGLVRFDGMRFERVDLFPEGGGPGQAQHIATLALGRDGALWVGFQLSGVMRLPTGAEGPGAARRWYDWNSGLPIGTVFALQPDAQGQAWAATSRGLYRLNGERWARVGEADGLAPGPATGLVLDADQTLWLAGPDRQWFSRAPGAQRFTRQPSVDGAVDLARSPDGRLWLLDDAGRVRPQGAPARSGWPTGLAGSNVGLLADRDGGLWLAHGSGGVRRIARPPPTGGPAPALETMDGFNGLSGSRVHCAYEDRDGNLWLCTTAGLDHFRPPHAVVVPFADGPGPGTMAPSDDGSLIAATVSQPPTRLRPFGPPQPLPGDYPRGNGWFGAAWRDPDGSVWIGGAPDLWHQVGERMQRITAPPEAQPNRPAQTIARDAQGQLWAAWAPGPMRRFTNPGWAPPAAAERSEIVMVLHAGADGGLWRGLANGDVVRRDAQGEQRWGRADGLALGMVLSLLVQPGRVWVGGEQGVALQVGPRFVPLRVQGDTPLRTVSGILASADGALWLNDESGILRIAPAQLQAWLAQPTQPVVVSRLDWRDGVLGSSPQFRLLPSAVAGSDGRLWFSRGQGVYWIDPMQPVATPALPAVQVTGLWADGRALDPAAPTGVPVAPQALRITYTAPLPGAALQLRYRVRLLGLDERWQDVGARREQVFNRLPPGHYQLELQALLGEQAQSAITTLAFEVPPAFQQTTWFRAVLAVLALGLGVLLYRWRVAAHCRRVQERIQARLAERERIARELHDTLLQGTQALSLQIWSGLQELPADDPGRQRLSRALDQADATLAEARDRVQDLRRHQQPAELSQALREAVDVLRGEQDKPVVLAERQGRVRPLATATWHEAFRFGLEAAQNALRHAQASTLTLQVHYGDDALTLSVVDDGVGLPGAAPAGPTGSPGPVPVADPQGAAAPGHFGLRGLQERAHQVGGQLSVHSLPGQGTQVQLRVRAAGAYALPGGWRGRWRALWQPTQDSLA